MAGGRASRMGGVEKAIVLLRDRPLISYVIDALLGSRNVGRVLIALSPRVPGTAGFIASRYAGEPRVVAISTPGEGYVEDTAYAARAFGLDRPFLIIAADIPLVTPEIIDLAIAEYHGSGTEALSVRVDAGCVPPGIRPGIVLEDGGVPNVPAGINIVDGRLMDRYQRERVLIVREGRLAANVNCAGDLAACERILGGVGPNR